MNELFRFIAVEGRPIEATPGVIEGGELVEGLKLAKDLEAAREADRAAVALAHMKSDRFVKGDDPGLQALLRIASAFNAPDAPSERDLDKSIREAFGHSAAEAAMDERFRELEQRLAESLLAARHAGRSSPARVRGELALALRVTCAIRAVASDSPDKEQILGQPWAQMIVFNGRGKKSLHPHRGNGAGAFSPDGEGSGERRTAAASEDPLRAYRARLEATIRSVDEAIPELLRTSAELPLRAEDVQESDEDPDDRPKRALAGAALAERVSEGAQQLLRESGAPLRHVEDFAVVEEQLSRVRAAARSQLRRLERRSSSRTTNVRGGSVPAARSVRAPGPMDLYFADPSPADEDPGVPGAPTTVGTAKVVQGLLMRVEDKVLGYETGALAKIVNIPAAATKSLETQLLTRTEETTETETGETSSTEQSVETDERFALHTETESEINLEMAAKAAGGFSAAYGPVSAEGSAEASTSFGMHSATSNASDYAKTVVEKAVSKLVKTKREISQRRRVLELRDLQKEGFDNTGGDSVASIYEWVDEVHEGRLVNYGSRLMLEFLIPQPGAVLLWSMTSDAVQKDIPQPPPPFDLSLDDIEPSGIADLVEEYGATDIPPAPPTYRFISRAIKIADDLRERTDTRTHHVVTDETLVVPEGYEGNYLWGMLAATHSTDEAGGRYRLAVGAEATRILENDRTDMLSVGSEAIVPSSGTVPIAITGLENRPATAVVVLRCKRTDAFLDQWRTEAYRALQQAHQRRSEEYEDKLRMARVRGELSAGARSPAQNRSAERDEIKRAAISILTGQQYGVFGAIGQRGPLGIPIIRFDEAETEGEYIQFFESAFEWTQIEYVLHPYFWANPTADWLDALRLRMDDPLYEEFLRAGAARVVVPVRPGFEVAMLTYLSHPDGPVLWDGQEYEDIDMDSELYYPVWRAIMERQGQTESAPIPVGDPWRFRIPTNHQIVSASGELPAPP